MFTSLRHRNKKDEASKPSNRKPFSKWSIDRALCQGPKEKLKNPLKRRDSEGLQDVYQSPYPQEYERTDYGIDETTTTRVIGVALYREECSLGVTLRRGKYNGSGQTPLIITQVKPGGPADKEGTIKVGDRLLAVDGQRLTGLSLLEAQKILTSSNKNNHKVNQPTWLTIEYDVSVMSYLRTGGPLLIQIESHNYQHDLGLSLIDSNGKVIISNIRMASIAERCGAFLPGDQILALNEYRVENSRLTANDVIKILNHCKSFTFEIEILPVAKWNCRGGNHGRQICSTPSPSRQSEIMKNSNLNQMAKVVAHPNEESDRNYTLIEDEETVSLRIESAIVTLHATPGQGFGLTLNSTPSKKAAVVCSIQPNSVADRSGVVQVGDRVISLNGLSPGDFPSLDQPGLVSLVLCIQFDVEVHSSILTPTRALLVRTQGSGFGITITGGNETPSPIVISGIRWGSVAHRSGKLSIGDQLIAINDIDIEGCMQKAMDIFRHADMTVSFIVLKKNANHDLGYSSPGLPSVDSAVESWDSEQNNSGWQEVESRGWTLSNATTEEEEETSSSYRLSESVLDAIASSGKPLGIKAPSPPCPLQTDYSKRKTTLPPHWRGSSNNGLESLNGLEQDVKLDDFPKTFRTFRNGARSEEYPNPKNQSINVFKVSLHKSTVFEDFGFSVSDGLYEKGVFINSIKSGSPADLSTMLKPFDKIVQVNDVPTEGLDCCLTVPLMASAGDKLTLTVVRREDCSYTSKLKSVPWVQEVGEEAVETRSQVETL